MVHHYVPTIHPFHRHFVNFPAPRCCHACSKSGHIAAFGHSRPPHHPHPGVTPLQHWPQRPFFWEAGTLIGGPPPLSSYPQQCFTHVHAPTSISGQIMPHLDPPVCPCHSSTWGSLAHHWPQRPSFQLVGAPIKCPPPPPISLRHSVHARCRQDNGSVCVPPIYASFGPQNITVITSQESIFHILQNMAVIGHIIHLWKGINEEIAETFELSETVQYCCRNS